MGPNDFLYIAAYVAALLVLTNRDAFVCFSVAVICCLFSASNLFDYANAIQVHLFYIITSLVFIPFAKKWIIKYSMFLMVLLNVIMIWDFYYYANVQTWTHSNYAFNTSVIHLLIICSLFYGRKGIISNNLFYVYLRRLSFYSGNISSGRFFSGGENIKTDTRFEVKK